MEHKLLRGPVKAVLGLLYPQQCLACGQIVASDGDTSRLCSDCWREARFISGAICGRCGASLPDDGTGQADVASCDDCLSMARPWQDGRAALVYAGTGRQLVLALKHGDRPDLAPTLGEWVAAAAAPVIRPDMVVTAIPLHMRRLIRRRYNQSALLARHVARIHDLPYLPDLLQRCRHTPTQDHRGVSDRFANICDSIRVRSRQRYSITGREVLVIDDVMTSGATLTAATDALLAAGSGPVHVAVLARAVKDD